jgi:hypothetical protein
MRVEEISEFLGSAPAMPAAKLGKGLMKECLNLLIRKDKLASRDKFKLFMGNETVHDYVLLDMQEPGAKAFFFTLPHGGSTRMFWLLKISNAYAELLMHEGFWTTVCTFDIYSGIPDPASARVFRFFGNLYALSYAGGTFIIENGETVKARRLGMQIPGITIVYEPNLSGKRNYRALGIDYIEKNAEGAIIRSSGVKLHQGGLSPSGARRGAGLTCGSFWLALNRSNPAFDQTITHVRIWLSDTVKTVEYTDAGLEETDGIGFEQRLYALAEVPIGLFDGQPHPNISAEGFIFDMDAERPNSHYDPGGPIFRFVFSEPEFFDASSCALDAVSEETLDFIGTDGAPVKPMPSAECFWNGCLWAIDRENNRAIYSNGAGTIYQEQTNAGKALYSLIGIGALRRLEATEFGLAAFGGKGIARISHNGADYAAEIVSSQGASENALLCNLSGYGAAMFDANRFLFIDEKTFAASEYFLGFNISECLGGILESPKACKAIGGKIYLIAGGRLFMIDGQKGTGLMEISVRIGAIALEPLDIEAAESGDALFVYSPHNGVNFPVVLSFNEGEQFERGMAYQFALCQSSTGGFAQLNSAAIYAKLPEGRSPRLTPVCDGIAKPFCKAANEKSAETDEYWEYFMPVSKAEGNNSVGKTIQARISFASASQPGYGNDGIEVLSVRLTSIFQGEVADKNFRPNRRPQ